MAQPIFDEDEHPLGEYLKDAGETQFFIPGSTPDMELELEGYYRPSWCSSNDDDDDDDDKPWRRSRVVKFIQTLLSNVNLHPHPYVPSNSNSNSNSNPNPNPSIERFKYTVISSSLLSPTLSHHNHTHNNNNNNHNSNRSSRSFVIPGKLQQQASSADTSLNVEEDDDDEEPRPTSTANDTTTTTATSTNPLAPAPTPSSPQAPDTNTTTLTVLGSLSVLFLSLGYPSLAVLFFLVTVYVYVVDGNRYVDDGGRHEEVGRRDDMEVTIKSLEDLISANQSWESIVQDTISFLEDEERTLTSTPLSPSPSSPPSPLRIALHTCLQTTHTQSDNIRHLFSALTSQTEISQLSEMYAPPSPVLMTSVGGGDETQARPWSYPVTISGSGSVLGHHHRLGSSSLSPSVDAMKTPERNKRSTWSGGVNGFVGLYASLADAGSPNSLINRRRERYRYREREKERVALVDVFGSEGDKPTEGDEERGEVEVQSGLFGTAALELQRKRRRRSEALFLRTPPPSAPSCSMSLLSPPLPSRTHMRSRTVHYANARTTNRQSHLSSYSPSRYTPQQPARHPLSFSSLTFALQGALGAKRYACAHLLALRFDEEGSEEGGYWEDVRSVIGLLTSALVDSAGRLSEALEDAEGVKMREGEVTPEKEAERGLGLNFAPVPSRLSRFGAHVTAIESALDDAKEHLEKCVDGLKEMNGKDALEAYERLRKELGVALRECERGREKLMEVVYPPAPPPPAVDDVPEDLPALGHDASDESDKPDPVSPRSEMDETQSEEVKEVDVDDVTAHLLMTSTAQHLPLPGIEEVFEADEEPPFFFRERSKLTREERIKARREKEDKVERWGPGGDVVQELKDVIWKVGEKKRQLALNSK